MSYLLLLVISDLSCDCFQQNLDEIFWLTDEKDPKMKTRLRERVSHAMAKVVCVLFMYWHFCNEKEN